MKANQAMYPIQTMAKIFGVSKSGFYAWNNRLPSRRAQEDAILFDKIKSIHRMSKGSYGAPRIHAELVEQGIRISRKRVERLMRINGISGISRRKGVKTTIRNKQVRPAPDLVDRNFKTQHPNQLWVADITYVPTWAGFIYLAVVLDTWSRKIVGWAMGNTQTSQLVLDALNMAITQRKPGNVIHHSDQGSQYTSVAFGLRCKQFGVRPSMGTVGDAYDNAMCESFFASLECELLDQYKFKTKTEAKITIFQYIEGWYNPSRRHSALGYKSPVKFEENCKLETQNVST